MTFTARMYSNLGTRHGIQPESWRNQAACRDADPNLFFPQPSEGYKTLLPDARAFCDLCPVRSECLTEARSHDAFGIWGGQAFGLATSSDDVEHGTERGYTRHRRLGEECQECLDAALAANRKRYRERRAS